MTGAGAGGHDHAAERELFRASVRRFVERRSPESAVRAAMETATGFDRALWREMAGQLGVAGLGVAREYGGAGSGLVELLVVFEELGRGSVCAPALSTLALAVPALRHAGDTDAMTRHLPAIVAGECVATLAVTGPSGRWDPVAPGVTATREPGTDPGGGAGGGWRLSGTLWFVIDGAAADLLVVAAHTPGGISLFTVETGTDGSAPGLVRTPMTTIDLTRRQARVDLDRVPATPLGAEGRGGPVLERVRCLAAVALAAEQLGGARRCLELSVEHARTRRQFGRPIGAFQAVKHTCADMLVDVEAARSAVEHAVEVLARDAATGDPGTGAGPPGDELVAATSLAKAYCSDVFDRVAGETVHVHGGTGFTWEHPAHLYLKRATTSKVLFGDPVEHGERMLRAMGVPG